MKAYQLSEDQVIKIARLCQQEQGTAVGAAAECSLALNLFEKSGGKYSSVYDYMRNSGWFAHAAYHMDYGECTDAVLSAVKSVLAGNRTLPSYIDEHDCFSDIQSISTGRKYDRDAYIKDKTIITNVYGSVYTFYAFPDENSDPFGYTSKPVEMVTPDNPIESAVGWMIDLAVDDSHGYSQEHRWGVDYDCSSALISAWRFAGIPLTCSYTGDMKDDFLAHGFEVVTHEVNLKTGSGLIRGDVLLNEEHHTALYIGEGMEAEASVNEKGKATGGEPGDQTGKEILIRPYRNFPWDCVLRYTGGTKPRPTVKTVNAKKIPVPYTSKGCTGAMVVLVQAALNEIDDYDLEVDGEFGKNTDKAVRSYQKENGLTPSGTVGISTFRQIMRDIGGLTYRD